MQLLDWKFDLVRWWTSYDFNAARMLQWSLITASSVIKDHWGRIFLRRLVYRSDVMLRKSRNFPCSLRRVEHIMALNWRGGELINRDVRKVTKSWFDTNIKITLKYARQKMQCTKSPAVLESWAAIGRCPGICFSRGEHLGNLKATPKHLFITSSPQTRCPSDTTYSTVCQAWSGCRTHN